VIYKPYGKTGKQVSALGFGGMRFRREDYNRNPEICAEIVRRANRLGINYFDTAPFYCDSRSEEIFGLAFKDMPNPFYVSTKSGISNDPNADAVRRRLEKSLKIMGVDKINFFHMWCILNLEQYKKVIAPGGPYEGALKAKEEGLVDHICVSTHCSGPEIKQIVEEGYFEGITLGYNIINFPFRQEGLKAASAHGLGVATMNPLGGGLIPQKADYFSFLSDQPGEPVIATALRFNVAHPEISTVLVGIETMAQLEQAGKILREIPPLTPEKKNAVRKKISAKMDRLCTGCGYCEVCPREVPVSRFMQAYNINILQNKEKARNTLANHWGIPSDKADACIACGRCEEKCTQHLPIIDRLKEIVDWKVPS